MIVQGDFRTVPVPQADLVLADPPYGLGKAYDGADDTTPYADWVEAIRGRCMAPWVLVFAPPIPTVDFARLKPDRVIVWCKSFAQIRKSLSWWRCSGVTPILVFRQPGAPWYGGSALPGAWDYLVEPSAMSDVHTIRGFLGDTTHPGVTGRAIARRIIRATTAPGDLVVDPMAGTGSILVAAAEEGRRVWGCEISPAYAQAGNAWLRKVAP